MKIPAPIKTVQFDSQYNRLTRVVSHLEFVAETVCRVRSDKPELPELEQLLQQASSQWDYEAPVYRFYRQPFKVYPLQLNTKGIVDVLLSLAHEGTTVNRFFQEILNDGMSGKKFSDDNNEEWTRHARPFLEAF